MSPEERALLGDLRAMWEELDPAPPDLASRALFRLEVESAFDAGDLDAELMSLEGPLALAGARGTETASSITFSSASLTVMLTVSPALSPALSPAEARRLRLDGWIAPSAALRMELRTTAGVEEACADDDGRFVFSDVPAGLVQLTIHPTDGAAINLTGPVRTPAVEL
jgi:hypothetical protein